MRPSAVAGITVGVVCALALIAIVVFVLVRRSSTPNTLQSVPSILNPATTATPIVREWTLQKTRSVKTHSAITVSKDGSKIAILTDEDEPRVFVYNTQTDDAPVSYGTRVTHFCLSPSGLLSFVNGNRDLFINIVGSSATAVSPKLTVPVNAIYTDSDTRLYVATGGSNPKVLKYEGVSEPSAIDRGAATLISADGNLVSYSDPEIIGGAAPISIGNVTKIETLLGGASIVTKSGNSIQVNGVPLLPPPRLRSMTTFGTDFTVAAGTVVVLASNSGEWSTHVSVINGHNYLFEKPLSFVAGYDAGFIASDGKNLWFYF
jgi:hypothetical protein